jgi:hypothetical protein
MEWIIHKITGIAIAEIQSDEQILSTVQDILDLMANADYQGARMLMLHQRQVHPDFFDLKTGLAGEILQKVVNYQFRLAFIGDFDKFQSKALQAFILESNRGKHVFFTDEFDDAVRKLTQD